MARVAMWPQTLKKLRGEAGVWTTYHDAGQPGLELRVSPDGVRSWSARPRYYGRRIRVILGSVEGDGRAKPLTLAEARAECQRVQREAVQGIDPRHKPERGALTVAELCAAALAKLELRDRTRDEWQRLVDVEIVPAIGREPAEGLTRHTIRAFGERIVKRGAPTTAQRAFEVLRRCYSWGAEADRVRATPFVNLKPPAKTKASDRWLTTEELSCVLTALAGFNQRRPAVDVVRLLLLTGVREENVIGMRTAELEDIAGDKPANPRWIIPRARMKEDREHVVPLSPQALAIIKARLPGAHGGCVFPAGKRAKNPGPMKWQSAFAAELKDEADAELRRRRGLEPRTYTKGEKRKGHRRKRRQPNEPEIFPRWTIHGLRHTIGTHMVEDLGVDPAIASLILTHKPVGIPEVSNIYIRAYRLAERREALNRWADWLDSLQAAKV